MTIKHNPITQKLTQWIIKNTNAETAQIKQIKQLNGGAIQENWKVNVDIKGGHYHGKHQWVLRKNAESKLALSHTKQQEFQILKTAEKYQIKIPKPIALCTDPKYIGSPFHITQYIPGITRPKHITQHPELEKFGTQLAQQLARELAKIHAITPKHEQIPFLTCPNENPALYRLKQYRHMLGHMPPNYPVLEYALKYLRNHIPKNDTITLCHADFRTGNYIVRQNKLAALLDWEFTAWSDPYEDIAWFTAQCWRFGNPHLAGGIAHAEDFYQEYERQTDIKIDHEKMRFWHIIAELRWALIALQQAERNKHQKHPDLELELTQHIVPEMEHNILQYIAS